MSMVSVGRKSFGLNGTCRSPERGCRSCDGGHVQGECVGGQTAQGLLVTLEQEHLQTLDQVLVGRRP